MTSILYIVILGLIFIPAIIYLVVLNLKKEKKINHKSCDAMNVSVILTCHNEEQYVKRKIYELIDQCRTEEVNLFEILVVSDGSTDSTNAIIKAISREHWNVKCFFVEQRKGKPNAINIGVKNSNYSILLLSDSRQEISQGSVGHMLKRFANKEIGAVSSKLVHKNQSSMLRTMVNRLKELESISGSTIGIYGPLYAIRKSCFSSITLGTILDDLFVSIGVLNKGKKVVIESAAQIFDVENHKLYTIDRSRRIVCGLYQFIRENHRVISKLSFKLKVFLYCQKYYKLLVPWLLVLATIFSLHSKPVFLIHVSCLVLLIIFLLVFKYREFLIFIKLYAGMIKSFICLRSEKSVLWRKSNYN